MRALGKRLGSAATAVYWHVGSKHNLIALGPAAAASLTRKPGRDGGNAQELLRDHMANAREIASRFPRLRGRLDTAAADYGAAPDSTFEFGLQAILDGLEARLVARPTRS
jgi:Tetracyclin repressor-like, C-terminal domain